jgi:hypothetical protein
LGKEVGIIKQLLFCRATFATVLLASGHAFSFAPTQVPSIGGSQGAQGPQTQVQTDNAESTSKPDSVQIPEANPSRPTITNPAHIPPVGYVQFEQGFLQANGSPSGLAGQFSLVEAIRLSVHPRVMVQFLSQPVALSRLTARPDNSANWQSGPGNLTLGLQGLLTKEAGRRPTIAVGYLHRVRAGSAPDLDMGSSFQSAVLLLSGDLGSLHYDSNFSASEQVAEPIRRAQFGQTLSVTHDLFPESLHDKLEVTGEIWHFTQPLVNTTQSGAMSPRSNAVGTLWALGYTVRPNLVLDGGLDRGITSTSTAWQGFAGFTYLLPHRLWSRRDTGIQPVSHRHVHRR